MKSGVVVESFLNQIRTLRELLYVGVHLRTFILVITLRIFLLSGSYQYVSDACELPLIAAMCVLELSKVFDRAVSTDTDMSSNQE